MTALTIYATGMATMFFGMMAWLFLRRGERLSYFVGVLMAVISIQCIKDLVFVLMGCYLKEYYWNVMTTLDIITVPMYTWILRELVRPGDVTPRVIVLHELPFFVFGLLYMLTGHIWIFYLLIACTAILGTYYLVWTSINIPRYNRRLKEQFSYTENINLGWLRVIVY